MEDQLVEKQSFDSIADNVIDLEGNVPTISECSIKNTDPSMTIKTSKLCVLCNKKRNHLSSHYNSNHSDSEPYNARMSMLNSSIFQNCPTKAYKYIQINENYAYCYYCEKRINVNRSGFYEHIVLHTGEYSKECSKVIPKISMQQNGSIHIFMCIHCNHTQLQEENLQKHIIDMHSIQLSVSKQYRKIVLAPAYDSQTTKPKKVTTRTNTQSESAPTREISKIYQNRIKSTDFKIEEKNSDEASLNFYATAHRANDKSRYSGPSLNLTSSVLGAVECKIEIKTEDDLSTSFSSNTSSTMSNDRSPSNSHLISSINQTKNRRKQNDDLQMIVCKKEKLYDEDVEENVEFVDLSLCFIQ